MLHESRSSSSQSGEARERPAVAAVFEQSTARPFPGAGLVSIPVEPPLQAQGFQFGKKTLKTEDHSVDELADMLSQMMAKGDREGIGSLADALESDLRNKKLKNWVKANPGLEELLANALGALGEVEAAPAKPSKGKAKKRREKKKNKKASLRERIYTAIQDGGFFSEDKYGGHRWGHTFELHGEAMAGDPARQRAGTLGDGVCGVWTSNEAAQAFLIELRIRLGPNPASVGITDLPAGRGLEYNPEDEEPVVAQRVIYKLNEYGGFVTAFPTNRENAEGADLDVGDAGPAEEVEEAGGEEEEQGGVVTSTADTGDGDGN